MSNLKQPVVGEKPFCLVHPDNHIDWTCAAGSCPYRALCQECLASHSTYFPHHSDQVSQLNDWRKQYRKLAKNFDPRESYQMTYHVEEVGKILKKEKYELEKISKEIDESFDGALSILFNKLKSLKDFLHEYLWRDFNQVYESYNSLVKKFSDLDKFDPKDEILEAMKKDLQKYFSEHNIKEYFDRVYSGFYDEMVFNNRLNSKELTFNLKQKRKVLEEGFRTFDATEFERKWTQEVDKFINSFEKSCEEGIFKETKLDFLNPKSPKLAPVNKIPQSANITCLSSLEGLSSSFISKIDKGLFVTLSDQRVINFLDPNQKFRVLKNFTLGEEEPITSVELLHLDPPSDCPLPEPPASFLMLVGGNDDHPSLELWDCLRNNKLASQENVHEYGISCLKTLKKERINPKEFFYVASGSSDGFIKLWQIDVTKPDRESNFADYSAKINLFIKICAHDSFISSIACIPSCKKFNKGTMISCSHDKSLYIWEWERELEEKKFDQSGSPCLKLKDNGFRKSSLLDDDEEEEEKNYGKKIRYAHTDRISSVILLNDKEDCSDLELYATGGGEGLVKIWSLENGDMVKTFSNSNHSPIFSMTYMKKDRIACTANEVYLKHFYVLIWNWRTSSLLLCIRDHTSRVYKILSIEEDIFASCDKNKNIKLWQLEERHKDDSAEKQKSEVFNYSNGLLHK